MPSTPRCEREPGSPSTPRDRSIYASNGGTQVRVNRQQRRQWGESLSTTDSRPLDRSIPITAISILGAGDALSRRDSGRAARRREKRSASVLATHNLPLVIDYKTYHRRFIVESISFAIRQRFGSTIKASTWFGQFREVVLKAAVRNIERSLTT